MGGGGLAPPKGNNVSAPQISIGIVTYLYSSLSQRRGPKSTGNKQRVWVLVGERHNCEGDEEEK